MPNGYQGPETHNERMLEQQLARANERIERLQAENDAFVLASTRETTATVTLNVAVAQRAKKAEARVEELEAMLRSVLTYVGRSQFLVGADALREEIEDVLLHE